METRRDQLTSLGLFILRVGVCIFMINHGYGKWQMLQASDFEKFADPMKLVDNKTALIIAVAGEFFAPMLVAIGFLTRFATIPTIIVMATAAFKVHANDPWFMTGAGASKEPAMLFLIPFLTLLFTGAGRFSVDGIIWPRKTSITAY